MKIACLMNHSCEGPARIEEWADERGYSLHRFAGYNEEYPDIDEFEALVVMGGPMSVNDAGYNPAVSGAIETVASYLQNERPVLGICLGAQMMASAAGGQVISGEQKEIGWFPIERRKGILPDWASEFPEQCPVFHWHGEQIELPPEAKVIASTEACPVQVFELGSRQWGFQCHFEVLPRSIDHMLEAFAVEVGEGGVGVQSSAAIRDGMRRHGNESHEIFDRVLDRWAIPSQ